MSWGRGLEEQVRRCPLTVAPSLWSAPVESAVIKTLALYPGPCVIRTRGSLAESLPAESVHALSPDPALAAQEIEALLQEPRPVSRDWVRHFLKENESLLPRLYETIRAR